MGQFLFLVPKKAFFIWKLQMHPFYFVTPILGKLVERTRKKPDIFSKET